MQNTLKDHALKCSHIKNLKETLEGLQLEIKSKNQFIDDKKSKINFYETEIVKINSKVSDFGNLMENLIQDNQKLRLELSYNKMLPKKKNPSFTVS